MPSDLINKGKGLASKTASSIAQDAIRERDKSFTRTSGPIKKKDDIVEDIVRAAASGIGLISESLHYRREKKKPTEEKSKKEKPKEEKPKEEKSLPEPQESDEEITAKQVHQTIWNLDDAERQAAPQETDSEPTTKTSEDFATAFLKRHPRTSATEMLGTDTKLSAPVVLPQRRPQNRARGFVRAYAPILAERSINQETFLDFIDTFNKSLIPNPWINAINLAGLVELAVPEPAIMLLGYGLEIATDAIMEAQSRFRSNRFLDRVNAEFFVPRGLVCLIATWRPDIDDEKLTVDFEGKAEASDPGPSFRQQMTDIVTQKTPSKEGMDKIQAQMEGMIKPSSGEFRWPEPAPLAFPSLNKIMSAEGGGSSSGTEKKKNVLDRGEQWLDEYMDKRAQVQWAGDNRDIPAASSLPRPEFRSRYADPNHPASSGDIVALVTGGRWQSTKKDKEEKKRKEKKEKKKKRSEEKKDSKKKDGKKKDGIKDDSKGSGKSNNEMDNSKRSSDEKSDGEQEDKKKTDGEKNDSESSKGKPKTPKKPKSGLSSLFQKDVLYLIIVNLQSQKPSDDVSQSITP